MKLLVKASVLATLLVLASCAHHGAGCGKCNSQCEMHKDGKKEGHEQCPMMKDDKGSEHKMDSADQTKK